MDIFSSFQVGTLNGEHWNLLKKKEFFLKIICRHKMDFVNDAS